MWFGLDLEVKVKVSKKNSRGKIEILLILFFKICDNDCILFWKYFFMNVIFYCLCFSIILIYKIDRNGFW